MKHIIYILTSIIFLIACSKQSNKKEHVSTVHKKSKTALLKKEKWIFEKVPDCKLKHDTISDKRYSMHLAILEKYNHKEKRGYIFSNKGDTINNFLYHQDIGEFLFSLNSKEKGIYKLLTNKVIFLILEKEPRMLDYGLTTWIREEKELEYFLEHISNPFCNSIPIENIINIIKTKMGEPHEGAKKIKRMILMRLEQNRN